MPKFKVGQKVKLVGDSYSYAGLHLNSIHPIHSIRGTDGYYISGATSAFKDDEFYFIEHALEAVEEESDEEFTYGQKVRILENGRYFGRIGTVTQTDWDVTEGSAYPYQVTFEDHDTNIYLARELEAVEPAKPATKFYVVDLDYVESFNTQEEAEAAARKAAEGFEGDTSLVVQVVKAFRVTSTAQEVTLA